MALEKKKKETVKRKEMVITLKSKPKPSNSVESPQFKSNLDRKRRDFRKKGTRGSSWIG